MENLNLAPLKSALTRAKKKGPREVIEVCNRAFRAFDSIGVWPDNWYLWQRAKDDAEFDLRRQGLIP